MERIHLGGVCGVYCGACTIYRARHDYDRKNIDEVLAPFAKDLGIADARRCTRSRRRTRSCADVPCELRRSS